MPFVCLSFLVLLVHGYHPYSQDAAIYIAGVEKEVNPSLFTVDAAFIQGHTRLSIFSYVLAFLVRHLYLPLDLLLLAAYIGSIILFLFACHRLAVRLFPSQWQQWGATLLPAACFTIPVAGTSLLLMDPYVTARSFTTPLGILAVACCLARSWKSALLWTILVLALHPLMGIYLICFVAVLCTIQTHGISAALWLCFCGFLLCGLVALVSCHHPITPAYREAVATHGYFFLSEWHWYEVMGLIAPVILMGIVYSRHGLETAMGRLAAASALMGATCYLSALCFVHVASPGLLARIQLLRGFDSVYCAGAVMLGGFIVSYFWSRGIWTGIACFAIAFLGMALADNQSYPQSRRIELPGVAVTNPWEQAFLWIRKNTPANAVFAADSTALPLRDEEAQGFRAISERSVLDGAKDPGVVAIFPTLAPDWARYQNAARGLDEASDSQRMERLRPYGVTWVLLDAGAKTTLPCPYRNSAVEVCSL